MIGCKVPGYAVIRGLAQMDIYIIALTYSDSDFTHLSKYVKEVMPICPPEENEEEFIYTFIKNADRWNGALILETSDSIAIAISRNKEALSKYYKIVTPDWEILKIFIEKERTYALAKECDVPHPQSRYIESIADLTEVEYFKFPCILKPVRSFEFISRFQVKNFKVENIKQLEEKIQLCLDAGQSMILQEIIPGPDENLYKLQGYINSQGKMVGKFFHRKLRQNPPAFGVFRVQISTKRNSQVEQLTEILLNQVNYKGYFSIEFKKDDRDGLLKLMENNCRMPRSGMHAIACGVNLPWIIFLDLVKNQQIDVEFYKKDFYVIELLADISNSLFHHKEEDIQFRDYFKPYLIRNKVFADLDFHDLRPFMRLTTQKLINLWRKIG